MGDVSRLLTLFNSCRPFFIALGDEVRLHIIHSLAEQSIRAGTSALPCRGLNVNEITERTSLSRPAVSHHLKILRDSGLVDIQREGTCNYYYLTLKNSTQELMELGACLQEFFDSGDI